MAEVVTAQAHRPGSRGVGLGGGGGVGGGGRPASGAGIGGVARAPPGGSFARASGRASQMGTDYHSRAAPQPRGGGGGGGGGGWGGGGGGLGGGGGGFDPSNRTSADSPFAAMVSHQDAYNRGPRR